MVFVEVTASGMSNRKQVKPTVMYGRLTTSARIADQIEGLVDSSKCQKMQTGIEEYEQTKHSPYADETVPAGDPA